MHGAHVRVTRLALAASAAALVLAGCGASTAAHPAFTVEVAPAESPVEVRAGTPGQQTSFLVAIADSDPGAGAAEVKATATLATVDRIVPEAILDGQVAEVWLTLDPAITADANAAVVITVSRGGDERTVRRSVLIQPMSSEGRERDARPHFDYWTAWLAANHPELGITTATEWRPVFVSTLLVVSHMSYFSETWELGLSWHAGTIPPNDWSQIYLRRRGSELRPSIAFKLDSFAGNTPPYPVTAPDVVVR